MQCDRCQLFPDIAKEIASIINNLIISVEEKDELEYLASQAVKNIDSWKAHILRSINQDQARDDVLDTIDDKSVLLVSDWAMKYIPKKYRESQRDWYGKRGISWHITVAIRQSVNVQMLTMVHIFEKCTQDSQTVLAIFDDVLKQLKQVIPDLSSVYMKQDNAGCYHSALAMLAIHQIAINNGVKLARLDFSDPQGGKGSCDRKAATIKNHMKRYLFSGHSIETAGDMKVAMESSGGIPGVRVAVCLPPNDISTTFKLEGVSLINNIEYSDEGMKLFKAYKIGKGKFTRWSELITPNDLPTLSKKKQERPVTFVDVKARKASNYDPPLQNDDDESSDDEIVEEDNEQESSNVTTEPISQKLFFCPENGCTKSFCRYMSLEKHLDCGRHNYFLENSTLYDKAMTLYATKLEQGGSHTARVNDTIQTSGSESAKAGPPMGWALKTTAGKKRFTETQKNYLMDIFTKGEVTGHKADPAEVSRSMRKAKNPDGTRMFDKSQFLTPQQISSFFSRKAKRKVVSSCEQDGMNEDESGNEQDDIAELTLTELINEVNDKVGLQHPITYDQFNICEMSSNNKLCKLSINMLKEISTALELGIADITVRRKKPYLDVIGAVVGNCSCQGK